MKFIEITDKELYLRKNYPFVIVPKIKDKMRCIHCDEIIQVGNFKVQIIKNVEIICCPNAPLCDGTALDWIKKPNLKNI
jgi:hypothetical protein